MSTTVTSISATAFADQLAQASPGELTIIDVRSTGEYQGERLANSINAPLQQLSTAELTSSLISQLKLKNNAPLYLLCASGMRASKAANLLATCGQPIIVIEGGLNALKSSGVSLLQSDNKSMSLERQVRIAAGLFILLGVGLGFALNPAYYGLAAFVGAGLIFAGITDTCGMALVLLRMPWNRSQH